MSSLDAARAGCRWCRCRRCFTAAAGVAALSTQALIFRVFLWNRDGKKKIGLELRLYHAHASIFHYYTRHDGIFDQF